MNQVNNPGIFNTIIFFKYDTEVLKIEFVGKYSNYDSIRISLKH